MPTTVTTMTNSSYGPVSSTPINDYHNGKVKFVDPMDALVTDLRAWVAEQWDNPRGLWSRPYIAEEVQAILDKHKTP